MTSGPQIGDIYRDRLVPVRYAEEYELVKVNPTSNTYSLRKLSTNEIVLESIEDLNTYYDIRVRYRGHF